MNAPKKEKAAGKASGFPNLHAEQAMPYAPLIGKNPQTVSGCPFRLNQKAAGGKEQETSGSKAEKQSYISYTGGKRNVYA